MTECQEIMVRDLREKYSEFSCSELQLRLTLTNGRRMVLSDRARIDMCPTIF